jgi:hypothetical protein
MVAAAAAASTTCSSGASKQGTSSLAAAGTFWPQGVLLALQHLQIQIKNSKQRLLPSFWTQGAPSVQQCPPIVSLRSRTATATPAVAGALLCKQAASGRACIQ